MGTKMLVPVILAELVEAFEFVSVSHDYTHRAYICVATGAIECVSSEVEMGADLPEDVEESDDYIGVPRKNDLDLGTNLVFSFVKRELPDESDTVSDMFRRRGAYRRFKDFLIRRGMSDKWYEFEAKSTEGALRAWCEDNDIPVREG